MFNKEDILAELAAGKSIEQIAQSAADALNAAKAAYDKQQEEERKRQEAEKLKKAQEEKKKKELTLQKKNRITDLFTDLCDYFSDFYPELFNNNDFSHFYNHFDPETWVNEIDNAIAEVKKIPGVAEKAQVSNDGRNWSVKLEGEDAKKAGDAIEKFLRENNLF